MQILTKASKAKINQKFGAIILAAKPIPQIPNPDFDEEQPVDPDTNPEMIDKYTGSRWLDIVTMELWKPVLNDGRNKLAQRNADDDWET